MASYSLAQRGSKSITSADSSPKDVALASPVKLGSSMLHAVVRDRRQSITVQRGTVTLAEAATSPQDVTITAVVLAYAYVRVSARENRAAAAAGAVGVTAKLTSTTNLRLQFYGAIGVAENIEIDWEVIEELPHYNSATVRILDVNTIRITWDGVLVAGETIDVDWEVWDADDIGDDLLEVLFREQRILAYLGENMIVDNQEYDDAGNIVGCRLRIFTTKANAENCTFDLPTGSPMETGELSRAQIVQDLDKATNNRVAVIRTLESVIATPGVS